jgi:peptidoglycan hydrolase-like protein with peptidoglycan-binding domain
MAWHAQMIGSASVLDLKLQLTDRMLASKFNAVSEPARQLATGKTTLTRMLGRRLMRNPMQFIGWAAGGAVTLAVFANIMLMQPERHRAPMFVGNPLIHATPQQSLTPLPPVRPANFANAATLERDAELLRRAELLRDIQVELGKRGFFTGDPDAGASTKTTQAIRDFQTAANLPVTGQQTEAVLAAILTSNLRVKDQILGLLKNGSDRLERPETVVAIQRALTKIGYGPLRDDGNFGQGTKTALERFERDRKLPARGENPSRTLRELAQASGIAID